MHLTATSRRAPIDFKAVADRTDLASVLTARLGPPATTGRDPHWICPFGLHSTPKLYLWNGGRRWRCWACGLQGDALDFIVRLENLDVIEAARALDPDLDRSDQRATRRPTAPRKPPELKAASAATDAKWHDAGWQAAADEIVSRSEANLWGVAARPARAWLRGRGLAEDTIRRFRLGFNPAETTIGGIKVARGLTIPWLAPGAWYTADGDPPGPRWCGVNVRRLMPVVDQPWRGGDKCLAVRGSARGYPYPYDGVAPGVACLICEGELDALVAFQELGHVVNVLTVGGAQQTPKPEASVALGGCPDWIVAMDHDATGDAAARTWKGRDPRRARRAMLPHGKDIGEFHQAGGSLLDWLAGEYDRFGWSWSVRQPLRPVNPPMDRILIDDPDDLVLGRPF